MSVYDDPSFAWEVYCDKQERAFEEMREITRCIDCLHSYQPSSDGFKDLDNIVAWCEAYECFTDPNATAKEIDCDLVKVS